jgi:hypothetical protein
MGVLDTADGWKDNATNQFKKFSSPSSSSKSYNKGRYELSWTLGLALFPVTAKSSGSILPVTGISKFVPFKHCGMQAPYTSNFPINIH